MIQSALQKLCLLGFKKMNEKEKLEFIKKEITGLNYLNLVLTDDISYHRETGNLNAELLYLNTIMESKFENILKVL